MREDNKISLSAFFIFATIVVLVALIVEDYAIGWTDDTFWQNLITAPLFFVGAFLIGGSVFGIVTILIDFCIKKIEDEFTGKAKIVVIIIVLILAFIIYAAAKSYN